MRGFASQKERSFRKAPYMKSSALLLKVVFSVIGILSISLSFNNCANRAFESQGAIGFVNASLVPIENGQPTETRVCSGAFPANASLCNGDDQGLSQATSRILGSVCSSSRKCEFVCNAGYNFQNGNCVIAQVPSCANPDPCQNGLNCSLTTGQPNQIAQPWVKNATTCGFRCNSGFEGDFCERTVQPSFACQGLVPANSVVCSGDEEQLTSNLDRILTNSCSNRKCEYSCLPGFNNVGGNCVQNQTNSCAASVPCVVGTQCTTVTGNPSSLNQAWVKSASHCGFFCTQEFEGNFCEQQKPPLYSCQGAQPLNAILCTGDDQALTSNTNRIVVGGCTQNQKCEYVCESGFNLQNGACVRQALSCHSNLPCVNGLNCLLHTGTPTQVNQSWIKGTGACSFTCTEAYEGELCERGKAPVTVSCANAQNTFPLVTHWSETTNGFVEGATGAMTMYNPNAASNRQIYNYGIIPRFENYLGENYEYRKVSDSEYLNWANAECQTAGMALEHRKPSSYSNWSVAKSSVIGNRGAFQMLYGMINGKSLVSIVLPPGWSPTDAPGKYPILFSGHYDLANHLMVRNHQMFQTLAYAYRNLNTPAIGVMWNGAGAIGSRTVQASARRDFNEIIQKVKSTFGGDSQRIFIYGGSRGGLTALSMTANPENYPYRIQACYAAVPPADFPLVAKLTGSSIPLLIGAAEWSIGLLDTWKLDFSYPIDNEMKGFTRDEAHLYVLAGTKDTETFESRINLSSPYMINALKAKAPRLFLEIGSHDFIVPWLDQFLFRNKLISSGVNFESRINYMAGHYSDSGTTHATASPAEYAGVLKNVADQTISNIFQHGRHRQYLNDYTSQSLKPIDHAVRFTLEVPRLQSNNVRGRFLMTGIPGTKFKLTYTYNGQAASPEGVPYMTENELDSNGVFYSGIEDAFPVGRYEMTSVQILKPGSTAWKTLNLNHSTTNWERGKLIMDVVDESVVGLSPDAKGEEIQRVIMQHYFGVDLNLSTNGFQNTTYGIVEE